MNPLCVIEALFDAAVEMAGSDRETSRGPAAPSRVEVLAHGRSDSEHAVVTHTHLRQDRGDWRLEAEKAEKHVLGTEGSILQPPCVVHGFEQHDIGCAPEADGRRLVDLRLRCQQPFGLFPNDVHGHAEAAQDDGRVVVGGRRATRRMNESEEKMRGLDRRVPMLLGDATSLS